jgi:hypothetical protein
VTRETFDLHVDPADETIRLGPLAVRFLLTADNSRHIAAFQLIAPVAQSRHDAVENCIDNVLRGFSRHIHSATEFFDQPGFGMLSAFILAQVQVSLMVTCSGGTRNRLGGRKVSMFLQDLIEIERSEVWMDAALG